MCPCLHGVWGGDATVRIHYDRKHNNVILIEMANRSFANKNGTKKWMEGRGEKRRYKVL